MILPLETIVGRNADRIGWVVQIVRRYELLPRAGITYCTMRMRWVSLE